MNKWIRLDEVDDHHGFNDREIVLCADEVSGLVSFGRLLDEENEIEIMCIDEIEFDICVTHIMKKPLPPEFNDE